jgi:hypothetical protein
VEGAICMAGNPFIVLTDIKNDGVIGDVADGDVIEIAHGGSCLRGSVSF